MIPCSCISLLQGLILLGGFHLLLPGGEGSHQPEQRSVVFQVVQQLPHALLDHRQLPLALGQDTAGQVLKGVRC